MTCHVRAAYRAAGAGAQELEDVLDVGGDCQRLRALDLVVAVCHTGLGDVDDRGGLG